MENFHFYQDKKARCWVRTHFTVRAESREEAEEIVRRHNAADVATYENGDDIMIMDDDVLYDSIENLSSDENYGQATIEVYYSSTGKEIINNQPKK